MSVAYVSNKCVCANCLKAMNQNDSVSKKVLLCSHECEIEWTFFDGGNDESFSEISDFPIDADEQT